MPDTVPVRTVNRQCSSGLQAVADVAAAIKAGYYSIGLAAGVETMSAHPMSWEGGINARTGARLAQLSWSTALLACSRHAGLTLLVSLWVPHTRSASHVLVVAELGLLWWVHVAGDFPQAASCLMPMGITSENVAAKFNLDRRTQDQFAVRSHAKAAAAQAAGRFRDEIVPVQTVLRDPKTKSEQPITVSEDDGIRAGATLEALGSLKAVFKKDGTTTAGNSSQVSLTARAVTHRLRGVGA